MLEDGAVMQERYLELDSALGLTMEHLMIIVNKTKVGDVVIVILIIVLIVLELHFTWEMLKTSIITKLMRFWVEKKFI